MTRSSNEVKTRGSPAIRIAAALTAFVVATGLASFTVAGDRVSKEQLARTVADLKTKAETSGGSIRVIVQFGAGSASAGCATGKAAPAEVAEVTKRAGISGAEPITGTDMAVMEVSPAQLEALLATGQICQVQEDKPDSTF